MREQLSLYPTVRGTAIFSDCGRYRYSLTRTWDLANGRDVAWIMLNPSKAGETVNDATLVRIIDYSRRWGFGGLVVANLFGLISTDPSALLTADDPIGPDNHTHLLRAALHADTVICAWGNLGHLRGRDREVLRALDGVPLHALAFTKRGAPKHPLRLAKKLRPVPMTPEAA